MMMDEALILKLSIVLLVFSISLYFDLKYQRIPNVLCVFTILIGFIVQLYFSSWSGLLSAVVSSGVAFLILFPTFLLRILGAGDVKLMVAIASFLDLNLFLWSLAYGLIAGFFTSVLLAIYKLGFKAMLEILYHYLRCFYLREYIKPDNQGFLKMKIPYAPALAIGWIWACSQNENVLWLISNVRYNLGV